MSRRGPKPQPAAIKEAKGNPGRRPVGKDPQTSGNTGPVSASASNIAPPKWLKGDGKRVWNRIAPRLIGIKILTTVDAETFARYCSNFGRWLNLQKSIDEEGAYYSTETGYSRPHPAMAIVLRLEPLLERAEDRFGLNPSERQRLFAQRAAQGGAPDLFSQSSLGGKVADKHVAASEIEFDKAKPVGALN